ncbi:hypothetical protein AVEN_7893-1 [Araneus ventricosus]|uniref:Uncharacterized protein n=1 Tax=Araneus ventricosus TaxID=182803 RepID=A0A4Y2NZA0_ARAVE|nr:hypothetical protein AVEN_7893-1 [Araneus ventricosus]
MSRKRHSRRWSFDLTFYLLSLREEKHPTTEERKTCREIRYGVQGKRLYTCGEILGNLVKYVVSLLLKERFMLLFTGQLLHQKYFCLSLRDATAAMLITSEDRTPLCEHFSCVISAL